MTLKRFLTGFIFFLSFGLLAGCVSLGRNPGFKDVSKTVKNQMDIKIEKPSKKSPEEMKQTILPLLEEKLTLDQAIRIALLNNQQLQAEFQELGIAKADLLQATLVKNPHFEGFARSGDEGTNTEFSFSQDVMDILLTPLHRRIASAQFEQVKLRVADAVLSLIAEVKIAFYEVEAAEQVKAFQQTVLQASEAAAELADRQLKAGNLKALDFANEQAAYEQAQLDFNRSQAAVMAQREPFNRLLGLSGDEAVNWQVESELPELPSVDPPLTNLEEKALSQRLDLAAARKQIEIFRRSLTATRLGIIPEAEAGFNTEKETDGQRVTGPTWNVEVPLFNWQQGQRARNKAELRQSQYKAAGFEVQVRSEVREAYNQLSMARMTTERYLEKIIPLREQIINLTQEQYNFMLMGVYQLLQAKQNEILARRTYIEALKEYWIARTNLERAIGGKLPELKVLQKSQPQSTHSQPVIASMQHTHHQENGGQSK